MRVIGHGRYSGEVYPQSAAAGGSPPIGTLAPLSRQRFIDGDTTQTGLNGAASSPFATIAQFIASRGNISVADAGANYVGWLMPALNGYAEDIAFPAHASTELHADSISIVPGSGTVVTGNVTWANIAGAPAATNPIVTMHNVTVTGSFTVTGNAPSSAIVFGGDEAANASASLGSFDSTAATSLSSAIFCNALVGSLLAGTANTSAVVTATHCTINGAISAAVFTATDCTLNVPSIDVNTAAGAAIFTGCVFTQGSTPVLTAPHLSLFDGPSWQSFLEAGGTRTAGGTGVGTVVLVTGGYNGGIVEGAALTDADVSVSLNGTGATAGFTGANSGNHYSSSAITASRTVTLKTGGGELPGDTILITRTNITSAFTLVIHNNAGTTIATIPVSARGFVLARFNGSDWVFAEGGSLIA